MRIIVGPRSALSSRAGTAAVRARAARIRKLAQPDFVPRAHSVVSIGVAGVSKTGLDTYTNLAHTTSSHYIVVRYPFHPLCGQRFRPVKVLSGPPAAFSIELPDRRLSVPAWMTEEAAASLQLVETPCLSLEALLGLSSLLELNAASHGSCPTISDQQTEGNRDDKAKRTAAEAPSTSAGSRSSKRRPGAPSRRGGRAGSANTEGRGSQTTPKRRKAEGAT